MSDKNTMVVLAAKKLRQGISVIAKELDSTPCEIEAEILSQSLLSDDCDECHVYWLEFQEMLEAKLDNKSSTLQ